MNTAEDHRAIRRKAFVRMTAAWILLPAFFLVTGGSLLWWEAWTWCAITLAPMTVFLAWIAGKDPEFMARRLKRREPETTQRRIMLAGVPIYLLAFGIPGFDNRFGWSEVPLPAVLIAMAVSLAGYLLILRTFMENRWAGRTVETGDGQQVITTGPYAKVRHPMYVGFLLMYLAAPVALGSWWAVLPSIAYIPVIVIRIINEEQVLLRDLKGYEEYRSRIRYRLLPHVW